MAFISCFRVDNYAHGVAVCADCGQGEVLVNEIGSSSRMGSRLSKKRACTISFFCFVFQV